MDVDVGPGRLLKKYSGSRDPRLPAWVPRACARSDKLKPAAPTGSHET